MTDRAEQYKSRKYQRTAEIESRVSDGVNLEERYKQEAKFALDIAGLQFRNNDKILDIACGAGGPARELHTLSGAKIEARDISEALLEQAREITDTMDSTRGAIRFAYGDMGHIIPSLDSSDSYKLITIMGGSFIYLPTKEAHQKALSDYYSILEPEGKLVMEWRARTQPYNQEQKDAWCETLGVKAYNQKPEDNFGQFAKLEKSTGKQVEVLKDIHQGDGFYFYDVDLENKDGFTYSDGTDGHKQGWYDSDGVRHMAFGRAYFNQNGEEEDLGPAHIIDYMSVEAFPTVKKMLEEVGFKNVRLEERPLSPDGIRKMFGIVAEK